MTTTPARRLVALHLVLGVAFLALTASAGGTKAPVGLPPVPAPADNAPNEAKIALGKQLYFDKRLSRDDSISCASCHDPAKGWSNGAQFATGFKGQKGGRNSPTVLNTAYNVYQFWDGRAGSLEEQALGPIHNPIEMAMPDRAALEKKLNGIAGYRKQFQEVFGTDVTAENVGKAIAAFERTVISADAPYDRFKAGDTTALDDAAKRGMQLFFGKANCSACHPGPNFTDNGFHNVGVAVKGDNIDLGRAIVTKLEGDRAGFKTPTLRDIAKSAPYMHDGSLATLEAVVAHYNQGGNEHPQLDEEIHPLKLSAEEQKDLVAFLRDGLASLAYPNTAAPQLPE